MIFYHNHILILHLCSVRKYLLDVGRVWKTRWCDIFAYNTRMQRYLCWSVGDSQLFMSVNYFAFNACNKFYMIRVINFTEVSVASAMSSIYCNMTEQDKSLNFIHTELVYFLKIFTFLLNCKFSRYLILWIKTTNNRCDFNHSIFFVCRFGLVFFFCF